MTWSPMDDLSVTLNADYTGDQRDTDFGQCVFVPSFSCENVELDSFTLVGANARFNISDEMAITLRGANLLDENYQELLGYASPGRGIFAGLELAF